MGNNGEQTAFYFRAGAQKLYGASHFSEEVLITGFSFRMMQGSSIVGTTLTNHFEVWLSTTAVTPATLNAADPTLNRGADHQLVRDAPLSVTAGSTLNGDGVTDWSTPIEFGTPYRYDPSQGNLLMEFGGSSPNGVFTNHFVDGWEHEGGDVGRVYVLNGGAGYGTDQLGLVIRFETTPVPNLPPPPSSASPALWP